MRVILMGRKPAAAEGLRYLIDKGIEVVVVVAPPKDVVPHWSPRLVDVAEQYGVPTASDADLYAQLRGDVSHPDYCLEDIDLVISLMHRYRIKKPLIELPRIACVNFHPAPLPEYRGYVGYNLGIYENVTLWAISAHHVDETFDTGDIIKILRFDVNGRRETAFTLEQKSQGYVIELLKDVIEMALENRSLPREPQGKARYFSQKDFEALRKIKPTDTLDEIERKIRAFWYPPYGGAAIEIAGQEFTLVSDAVLAEIGREYHQ